MTIATSVRFTVKETFQELFDACRYDICKFSERFLDVTPTSAQRDWFNTEVWAIERMFVAGNRSGKSVSSGIKHLHHILYQTRAPQYAHRTDRYIRVNLSLTIDMANISYQWALNRAMDSPLYRRFIIEDESKAYPFPKLVVGDGKRGRKAWRSELWARSLANKAKWILGKDFDGAAIDEAAFVPDFMEIIDNVVLMRLADRNGQLDYYTSPNGKNAFYNRFILSQVTPELMRPPHYWFGMTASSYTNTHINQDRLKINAARLSDVARLQNIDGVFADVNGVFNTISVERCYRDNDWSLPVPPLKDALYIKAFDFAFKHDQTVGIVARVDVEPAQVVYINAWGGEGSETGFVGEGGIYEQVAQVHSLYPGPIYGDSTGPGGKLILEALTKSYNVPMKESDVAGHRGQAKENLILSGRQALDSRRIIFPYHQHLVNQLVYYVIPDNHIDTDYVFAFCILAEAIRKESYHHDYVVAEEPAVWATRQSLLTAEDGQACNCVPSADLRWCRVHHLPITDNICCGGETAQVALSPIARQILSDLRPPIF